MENLQSEKERMLWKEAKKRVGFRNHVITYLVINALLWAMWFIGGQRQSQHGIPWPVYSSLGWGFGLFWHFMGAFVFESKLSQVEREYEKLKSKNNT